MDATTVRRRHSAHGDRHRPYSRPIALASCIQVDACTPNAVIQEQSLDIHYNESGDVLDYLADQSVFDYREEYVDIPGGPGLGIEIDEGHVREQAGDVD